MRVAIYTLGCKVNQYETQAMEQELLRRGHTLVPAETEADGYIVNTCSVTAISDKKSRQMIRRCHKLNPNAVVAACGCYVQTHPEVVAALDVDLLAGTGDRMAFLDLFEQAAHEKEPVRLLDDALRRREFEVLLFPAKGFPVRLLDEIESDGAKLLQVGGLRLPVHLSLGAEEFGIGKFLLVSHQLAPPFCLWSFLISSDSTKACTRVRSWPELPLLYRRSMLSTGQSYSSCMMWLTRARSKPQ